ncbi:MAG: tetratricopeptide repeat protein [Leeuwenhoekiella sp.]
MKSIRVSFSKVNSLFEAKYGLCCMQASALFCLLLLMGCRRDGNIKPVKENVAYEKALNYTDGEDLNLDSLSSLYSDIGPDTLKRKIAFKMAYRYYHSMDSLNFRIWNKKALAIAERTKDKNRIGLAHFNLGNFFDNLHAVDSSYYHYYKAYNAYSTTNNRSSMARVLHNMAVLQEGIRDFTGSEVILIRSLEIAQELQDDKLLYLGFTLLGIVSNGLGNYSDALKYHREAQYYAKNLDNQLFLASISNNIGVVYRNMGNLPEAILNYKKALSTRDLQNDDPELYARALENLAYANFLEGKDEMFYDFSVEALKIRDSLSDDAGIIVNRLHLGEYNLKNRDTLKAVINFNVAKKLSKETDNFRYILESLLWLSKADRKNSAALLSEYVSIKDSLDFEDRKIRNKFERIRFETDEYIERNELLKKQNLWIVYTGAAVILVVVLFYFYREQKVKNKELFFDYEQQKSNERIYELLLLQEEKREEGRKQEQLRISGELHDGVLSQVFGVRMSLGFLMGSLKNVESRISGQIDKHIDNIHQIETEIREISHNLANHTILNNSTFLVILENFVAERSGFNGLEIKLRINGEISWDLIDNEIKINVFRILQEATQNAMKYSQGTMLLIAIDIADGLLLLNVSDNGIGFKRSRTKGGIGIKSMTRRVNKCKGEIYIQSSSEGTDIKVKIPI